MNKTKILWSLTLTIFILLLVGIVYYFNNTSYAVFSDEVISKKTIELSVSNENICVNNANSPVLENNMIPVYFDQKENAWRKADKDNQNDSWYNYCDKKWANVVTVKNNKDQYLNSSVGTIINNEDINTMFVWIPRYKYQVFNYNENGDISKNKQEILLAFEKNDETTGDIKCEKDKNNDEICTFEQKVCNNDTCNDKTYTHPAFMNNKGFWIGKFELTGDIDNLSVLFDSESVRNTSIKGFNDSILNMTKENNVYGFDKDLNIHMINNQEWGAVSYLAYSKYGKASEISNNNCSKYITGIGATKKGDSSEFDVCDSTLNKYYGKYGVLASTTGNVYGVYDMNGGSFEYVLGVSAKDNKIVPGASGYISSDSIKNINLYKSVNKSSDLSISSLGDGIREVKNGASAWDGSSNYVSYIKWPWLVRGGSNKDEFSSGIFASSYSSGSAADSYSTRIIISK